MAALFGEMINAIKQMNSISRTYIRLGNVFIFTSAVLALFCRLCAGTIGVYDNMIILSGELFELFRLMTGAIYVPALIIEIVRIAIKNDSIN